MTYRFSRKNGTVGLAIITPLALILTAWFMFPSPKHGQLGAGDRAVILYAKPQFVEGRKVYLAEDALGKPYVVESNGFQTSTNDGTPLLVKIRESKGSWFIDNVLRKA